MNKKFQLKEYWDDIDLRLEKLLYEGEAKLPSLKQFNLDLIAEDIFSDMGLKTFMELPSNHKKFLEKLEIDTYLAPRLYKLAKKFFNYKGEISNQYHIARKVEPGNSKEMFRAHFDSHIFTVVFPIKIPTSSKKKDSCGELIYFPKLRNNPKNEIKNFAEKLYFKRYASNKGIENLSKNNKKKVEGFNEYEPLIFFGKTTLHTNYPVSESCNHYRLTLLAHYFDDTPKLGIGSFLRFIRKR